MKGRFPWLAAGVLSAACAAGAGCVVVHRTDTTLHDDGSVERAVVRVDPVDAGPTGNGSFHETLDFLGRFKAAGEMPDHYVRKAPEGSGLPDGKLVRDYQRSDHVLVTEHVWRETLTDAWKSFDDMRAAREELAELAIEWGRQVFEEILGKDYDAGGLVDWARKEGKPWLVEVTDAVLFRLAAHAEEDRWAAVEKDVIAICSRHGLVLKDDGKGEPAWEEFWADLVWSNSSVS